jgi:cyclopropane-fatty-acyl-phospholipid synthase
MSDHFDVRTNGASQRAIEQHYDVGNAFFRLWLGDTMSYSCAQYGDDENESLEAAQLRKIDAHLAGCCARGARRFLDIGCGWGSVLSRAVSAYGVERATGVTLSPSQREWVVAAGHPNVDVRLESWLDHRPDEPYDAMTSLCAIEAFTRQGLARHEKVDIYRTFFARCHEWLRPEGWLSLQCITYGNAGPENFSDFIASEIFPENDLPRLTELVEGFEGLFEVGVLRNDRSHYVRTLATWSERLRKHRAEAVALAGEPTVVRFQRYLKLSGYMFMEGACDLVRVTLRRIDHPRSHYVG